MGGCAVNQFDRSSLVLPRNQFAGKSDEVALDWAAYAQAKTILDQVDRTLKQDYIDAASGIVMKEALNRALLLATLLVPHKSRQIKSIGDRLSALEFKASPTEKGT
jgi:hypothetical protein